MVKATKRCVRVGLSGCVGSEAFGWCVRGCVLVCENGGWLTDIEWKAAVRAVKRGMRKKGLLREFVCPRFILYRKSEGSRMGKGKGGKINGCVCRVRTGQVLLGVAGYRSVRLRRILLRGAERVGVKCSVRCV